MACSKYISTKETANSARVSRLILGPCTDLFRDVFRIHISEIQFPFILQKKKTYLSPILSIEQKKLLYPKSGHFIGTYHDLDLSLLYTLLRNLSGIPFHKNGWGKQPDLSDRSLSANIDRIREIRNTHCGHTPSFSLSDADFQTIWQDVTVIIGEIEKSLPGGCTNYTDAAKSMKTDLIDPTVEDKQFKFIEENTKAVLKDQQLRKVYIITSAVQNTMNKLKTGHIVILTGKIGAGKTTTAYNVLIEMSKESAASHFTPFILPSPDEWDIIIKNQNKRCVVYFEYFKDSMKFPVDAVEKWKKHLNTISSFTNANSGDIKVLIELKRSILDEAKIYCMHKTFQEANIIDLSAENMLTLNERQLMLRDYENHFFYKASELVGEHFSSYAYRNGLDAYYKLSDAEKRQIVNLDPYYGFPLTCHQFFSMPECFQLGPSFFLGPLKLQYKKIENMRIKSKNEKLKYCVLCYVLIQGGIDSENICPHLLKKICKILDLKISSISDIDLKDAITELSDLCLKRTPSKNYFKFSHESFLDAVLVSLGILAPDIVMRHCSKRKIIDLIRTQNYTPTPDEVVLKIPIQHYECLAQRMLDNDDGVPPEIRNDSYFIAHDIVCHPASDDPDFVAVLLTLDKSPRVSHIISEIWRNILPHSKIKPGALILAFLNKYYDPRVAFSIELQSKKSTSSERRYEIGSSKLSIKNITGFFSRIKENSTHCFSSDQEKFKIESGELHTFLFYCVNRYENIKVSTLIVRYICQRKELCDLLSLKFEYSGKTPLHYCILHGWEELVDLILKNCEPTDTDDGWTCAHLAAFAGRTSILKKFLLSRLDQNVFDITNKGYSIFQAALLGLRFGSIEVRLPSAQDVSSNLRDFKSRDLVLLSEKEEYEEVIRILLRTKIRKNIHSDLYLELDEHKNNIFHYLVINNYAGILNLLIKHNTDIAQHCNSSQLPTTLHTAVYLGRREMFETLWKAGICPLFSDLCLLKTLKRGNKLQTKSMECRFFKNDAELDDYLCNYKEEEPICSASKTKEYGEGIACWFDMCRGLESESMKLKTIVQTKVKFGSFEDFDFIGNILSDKNLLFGVLV